MRRLVIMNGEGWPGIGIAEALLKADAIPLDVVEQSIREVERDPRVHTVGYNSPPNALGVMQLDASCMNGDTLESGAVGALEGTLHPISVAREVMRRLPHVMLVGAGAQRFARECGFPEEDLLSPEARAAYEAWRTTNLKTPLIENFTPTSGYGSHGAVNLGAPDLNSESTTTPPSHTHKPPSSHGTVICLVRSAAGSFAGGVSTSGWDYKYPGRLGDSPIIGAGLYVDSRYGAAACTHCGENAIRTALARSVVLYMKRGASVEDAVREGLDDLRGLQGGYQGQVVIYAADRSGELFVARRLPTATPSPYLVWHDGLPGFERHHAQEAR